jgi:hypothetical protein
MKKSAIPRWRVRHRKTLIKRLRQIGKLVLVLLLVGAGVIFHRIMQFARTTELSPSCLDCEASSCQDMYPFRISYVHSSGLFGGKWIGEAFPRADIYLEQKVCHTARRLSPEFRKIPKKCLQETVNKLVLAGQLKSSDKSNSYLGFCLNNTKTIVIHAENPFLPDEDVFFHEFAHLILNSGYMTEEDKNVWSHIPTSSMSFVSQKATHGIEEDMAETLAFVLSTRATNVPGNETLSKKIEIAIKTRQSWCPQMD